MNIETRPAPDDTTIDMARPRFGVNHVIAYGQSLSSGWEGWPALSVAPRHDSLMLGRSVRPCEEYSAQWQAVGEAVFHPLRATVQRGDDLLTAQEIAALPAGNSALGETILEAAVNTWRGRMLGLSAAASGHRLLASSCGVGGQTLEQLSKGARPEFFNRLRDCATAARQAAIAGGQSYGITALLLLQGESNSWALNHGTADRTAYKALLRRFYEDFTADIAAGIAGQASKPALFLHQTSGAYASETLSVAQAQLETALELPTCFLAAPVYPVTDKASGHLDANGYRWLGAQFGKVMYRVLTLGEDWKPLHPVRATAAGQTVTVSFHVPAPPLVWGRPFAGHAALDIPDKGFTVQDESGIVPITSVALTGPDRLCITLERPVGAAARLLYADKRHRGRGCLHDSDRDFAEDRYDFDAAAGHYPSADIPELVGRPYPLMNWCAAFNMPLS